ncbi:hypothetical protein Tco_0154792 [Tanacetum coccineum]
MSQGFMNSTVNTAKGITNDAGKRRVQADGQATGHLFTNGDGKRVGVFTGWFGSKLREEYDEDANSVENLSG